MSILGADLETFEGTEEYLEAWNDWRADRRRYHFLLYVDAKVITLEQAELFYNLEEKLNSLV